ncbi:hypothetical protein [Herbaspirillum sp. SJZ107]|uniref:hypothetical protein n=1 Tax=Herbaspirillum sp. SJZ107 TaxID=2572881 RepID=UPI00114EA640|nr:hypothetical protein [Herbaspirillum sp. SJZ107]TQK10197.1 hypothetical protein FBX97_0113 [Herbaspirillum sp. SJZ107]
MKRRRSYNPFPTPFVSRRQRFEDAIASDNARARRDTAAAKAQEAATQPAANDDQTEKKQNG